MDEKTLATVRHRTTIGIYSISRITAEEEPDTVVEVWAGPSPEALEAENDKMRTALKLGGGHLRADGSVCDYLGGATCNKCGHVDDARLKLEAENKRLRGLVEAGISTMAYIATMAENMEEARFEAERGARAGRTALEAEDG